MRGLADCMVLSGREKEDSDPAGGPVEPGVLGGAYFPRDVPAVDLSGGISPTGLWDGKIYGLWFYGGDDAQRDASGKRSLVFFGEYQLLLRRTVFCRLFDEADGNTGGGDLQSDEDV